MCEGQAFDIGFETATFVTFEEYVRMIEGKTAALLAVACELGAWAAGASDERAAAYSSVGRAYGLAFQVRDDVLGTWGRTGRNRQAQRRRHPPAQVVVSGRLGARPAAVGGPRRSWPTPTPRSARSRKPTPTRVIAALERLGARDAADEACLAYIDEANAHLRRPTTRPRRPPRRALQLHREANGLDFRCPSSKLGGDVGTTSGMPRSILSTSSRCSVSARICERANSSKAMSPATLPSS